MAYQGNVPAEAYTTTAKDTFNGNGSTTAFTLSLPTVTNDIRVVVENVVQEPTAAYSVSGTTLTFTAAPPSGTGNVYVVHLGPAVQTVEPPSTIAGATTFASTVSAQSDLLFPDNSKAIFGAGSDLQIYHDGSASWVKNTGDLVLQGNGVRLFNNSVDVVADFGSSGAGSAAARLFFAGNGEKLATTATGIDVTGNATANGSGNVEIKATTTSNAYSYLTMGTWGLDRAQIRAEGANPGSGSGTGSGVMSFWTAQNPTMTEAMRIDSNGALLLNTTSRTGTSNFVVSADTDVENPMSVVNTKTGVGNDYAIIFYRAGSIVGSVQTSLSATSYVTSSDYRLKTDAQPMTGASARVQALKPVNFEWISTGDRVDGFLAHEAQEIVPEAVVGTKDAMRDEEYEVTAAVLDADGMVVTEAVMGTRSVPDYQGIDQSKLVPLLTAALQEALNKIDAMETRLSALEGN
jgi:hypothetical protein